MFLVVYYIAPKCIAINIISHFKTILTLYEQHNARTLFQRTQYFIFKNITIFIILTIQ